MSIPLTIIHLVQLGLGSWGLQQSYTAITNLRSYEDKAKTAAKYSRTASTELHRTRTTQASGAIAICLSVGTSAALLATSTSYTTNLFLNILNVGTTLAARVHIDHFWSQKSKVPTVKAFNDAIEQSNTIKMILTLLSLGWVGTALMTFVIASE